MNDKCEFCGSRMTEAMFKINQEFMDTEPCTCKIEKEILRLRRRLKKYEDAEKVGAVWNQK